MFCYNFAKRWPWDGTVEQVIDVAIDYRYSLNSDDWWGTIQQPLDDIGFGGIRKSTRNTT